MEKTFKDLRISTQACRIASFIYAKSVLETSSGNWQVDFEELEQYFEINIKDNQKLINTIEEELNNYEGIAEVDINEEGFDVILWLDYCASTYVEGQDEIYMEEN